MAVTTEDTSFTHDILGRYVCNTFAEAKASGTFDVIIVGGGTFGLTLAQDLFERSRPLGAAIKPGNYRILVLDGGPFTLPEHVQDLPSMGLAAPGPVQADPATLQDTPSAPRIVGPGNALPATRLELMISGLDKQAVFENWGMPWNSSIRFGGLAYCLGGRSLYFGGWSPRYLATEMETAPANPLKSAFPWPQTVVDDLKTRYFLEGAKQTGASTSNDYIAGDMHNFFRKKLFNMYTTIPNFVPLNELPDYAAEAPEDMGQGLQDILSGAVPPPYANFQASLKVDAPLAVQILSRPGFFPFNKFSSAPLGITAARRASSDATDKIGNTDKRVMIVPNCHVKGLRTRSYTVATGATVEEIDGIFVRSRDTGDDLLDLSPPVQGNTQRRPVVILAMGAIESARMAILTPGVTSAPNGGLVGNSLMVHLRKNSQFTVPIPAGLTLSDLELTALLVRCRAKVNGAFAHYHFQISASAALWIRRRQLRCFALPECSRPRQYPPLPEHRPWRNRRLHSRSGRVSPEPAEQRDGSPRSWPGGPRRGSGSARYRNIASPCLSRERRRVAGHDSHESGNRFSCPESVRSDPWPAIHPCGEHQAGRARNHVS